MSEIVRLCLTVPRLTVSPSLQNIARLLPWADAWRIRTVCRPWKDAIGTPGLHPGLCALAAVLGSPWALAALHAIRGPQPGSAPVPAAEHTRVRDAMYAAAAVAWQPFCARLLQLPPEIKRWQAYASRPPIPARGSHLNFLPWPRGTEKAQTVPGHIEPLAGMTLLLVSTTRALVGKGYSVASVPDAELIMAPAVSQLVKDHLHPQEPGQLQQLDSCIFNTG